MIRSITERLRGPKAEAGPMLSLSVAQGAAMFLSFLFYIAAARVLAPGGFGVVRYTISLAEVAFGALQVLATSLVRELGSARGDEERIGQVIGSSAFAAALLWLVSCGGCALCAALGAMGSADLPGLIVVFTGLAAFNLYWALGRGLGEVRRMALIYIGASAVQLVVFGCLIAFARPTEFVTLVVFGVSNLVPIAICEFSRPILRRRRIAISRTELRVLWRIGRYLLAAQLFYIAWNAIDQVWVATRLGSTQVGLYGSAANLSRVFLVIQLGVAGILLPRVAELRQQKRDHAARKLIAGSTTAVTLAGATLLILTAALRVPLLDHLYGPQYASASTVLLALSASMVLYTTFATVTTAAIGWGRPGVYLVGMGVGAGLQVALLSLLQVGTINGTAWVHAASIGGGLVAVVALLAVRPLMSSVPDRGSKRAIASNVGVSTAP